MNRRATVSSSRRDTVGARAPLKKKTKMHAYRKDTDNPEFSMSEHILILGLVPKVVAFRYSLVVELWMRVTGQTLALPASARDCLGDKLSAVSD